MPTNNESRREKNENVRRFLFQLGKHVRKWKKKEL